ncbi:MAG: hypothetical protein Ta2G_02290 [Termitinemataceae bacterium]|nr:MAG: hypothetical protein Ta2G_02290 [Termitinemataceae bacterium]
MIIKKCVFIIFASLIETSLFAQNIYDFDIKENDNGTSKILDYHGKEDDVIIPDDRKITEIAGGYFLGAFGRKGLNAVSIPNEIKIIGKNAFSFNNLSKISIGADVDLSGAFNSDFEDAYIKNNRREGTYTYKNGTWVFMPNPVEGESQSIPILNNTPAAPKQTNPEVFKTEKPKIGNSKISISKVDPVLEIIAPAPQPIPQPAPQPVPQPVPQPIPQPIPQPVPQIAPEPKAVPAPQVAQKPVISKQPISADVFADPTPVVYTKKRLIADVPLPLGIQKTTHTQSTRIPQRERRFSPEVLINFENSFTHIVRSNETFFTIARKYYGAEGGLFFALIMIANDIGDPDYIEAGDILIIPDLNINRCGRRTHFLLKNYFYQLSEFYANLDMRKISYLLKSAGREW